MGNNVVIAIANRLSGHPRVSAKDLFEIISETVIEYEGIIDIRVVVRALKAAWDRADSILIPRDVKTEKAYEDLVEAIAAAVRLAGEE